MNLGPFRRSAIALALGILIPAAAARAQTPDTASVEGSVADATGAPVSGAQVELRRASSNFRRASTTGADGRFKLAGVPVAGDYVLEVHRNGFSARSEGPFGLRAGEIARFEEKMSPEAVSSSVTVYGTTGGVQSNSPQLGVRLDRERIENTPVLGNKITSLPLLNSAVRPARGTGDLFLNNTLFVIDGGGRRQPAYWIDGATGNDSWGRQSIITNLPTDTLQEMTVLTNAATAEYGRTTGGVINVVTRSGTSTLHGQAGATYRPSDLEAKAPVTGADPGDELKQGDLSLSGPLARNVYFFADAQYTNQDRFSAITSPLVDAPDGFTGNYRDTLLFGKVDADVTDGNRATARYSSEQFHDTNPQDVVGGTTLPSAGRTFRRNTYSGQLADTAVISDTLFNEASASVNVGSPITDFTPNDLSTQFVRPGVSTEGESRAARLFNHQYQFADTLSWSAGNHSVKLGGDVEYSLSGGNSKEFGGPFILGQFTFNPGIDPTIPTSALGIGDVASYTQGFGDAKYEVSETLWSLFAQDDFRPLPDLTINVGIRYDRQTFTDDRDDFSPRIGFAWNPGGDPRTSVHGGFGLYYSEVPANLAADYEIGGPNGIFTFSAQPGQLGFPPSLEPLPGFPEGAVLPPRNVTIRSGNADSYSQFFDVSSLNGYPSELKNPQTDQTVLGVERQIGDGWFVGVDLVHSRTIDIVWELDLNAPTPFDRNAPGQTRSASAADATRPITPVPNGYRQILVTTNDGESKYDALQLNARKDFGGHAGLQVSWTWSHTRDNVESDATAAPNDANQLDREWADSLLDQRHRVVLSGWSRLPLGLRGGGVFSAATGRPYNVTTGADNNGDGSRTDRPVIDGSVIGRNSARGNAVYDLSLFLEKSFPISGAVTATLRAEGFNITNHENVYGYNGVYGNGATPLPTFGQPLGGVANVEPGRQFEFSARLAF